MLDDFPTLRKHVKLGNLLPVAVPSGRTVAIQSLVLQLPNASPGKLPAGTLSSTYMSKPLLDLNGEHLFGEVAVARLLTADGWSAVWADTFHGGKFWTNMPHKSAPVRLPAAVAALHRRIADLKGGASGCFDVIGWHKHRTVFLEYKSLRDKSNRSEVLWIAAALAAGVLPEYLYFVGQRSR